MKDVYQKFLNAYKNEKPDNIKESEKLFDKACREFQKAELLSNPSASLLVKKGICIQLSSEACPYSLEDAEKAFKDAIEEDEDCVNAYVELAHYHLNIQDDPITAKSYFDKALNIALEMACVSICGIALCISEMESPEIALEYLKDNSGLFSTRPLLENTMGELRKKTSLSE